MSSLTVSPAVAEHIDGPTVVMVVKGEPADNWHHTDPRYYERPNPPADLVALRDARCEMCDDGCDIYACCVGTMGGSVTNWDYLCDRHRDHQGFHDCAGCCPDCHDGRKLVKVRWTWGEPVRPVPGGIWTDGFPPPDIPHTATRHGLIDVVPVVGHADTTSKLRRDGCLAVGPSGVMLWRNGEGRAIGPANVAALEAQLGRPITPGDFAVVFEAVEQ